MHSVLPWLNIWFISDKNSLPYKVRTSPLHNSPPPENILLWNEKGEGQVRGSKDRENHQPGMWLCVYLNEHRYVFT